MRHTDMMERPILIVALDLPTLEVAARLVDLVLPVTPWFKIGSVLFTSEGPDAVRAVQAAGGRVFLDLKFHDIPSTVAGGVTAAADLGVALVTVHCAAGGAAMEAAAEAARRSGGHTRVLGVTRLTSDAGRVGTSVLRAAASALEAGLDGVVASARECARIKSACGSAFRVLTPAIRPCGAAVHDQARVATPGQAVRSGADYLVVGRPITAAADPAAAAQSVAEEMAAVYQEIAVQGASPRGAAPR